ncbi:MAG: tetratricopeptide (TPR) repeat protein [Verrucomicrobiales bacterium]|jgi:tetratricopeptide (TPR) repeat protein
MISKKSRIHSFKKSLRTRVLPLWPMLVVLGGLYVIYLMVDPFASSKLAEPQSTGWGDDLAGVPASTPDLKAGNAVKTTPPIPLAEREETYTTAVKLADQGDLKGARLLVGRLAPLTGEIGDGHAEAHVWLAKDLFSGSPETKAPAPAVDGTPAPRPVVTEKDMRQIGQHLKRATELAPDSEEAFLLFALFLRQTGQTPKAVTLLSDAVERLPNLRLMLAALHERIGETPAAKEVAREAALFHREMALSDPTTPSHRLSWARAEMLQTNGEAALAIIDRGEELHRDELGFHTIRLKVYMRRFQRALKADPPEYKEALALMDTLLEIDPDRPEVIAQIGVLSIIPETQPQAKALLTRISDSETTPGITHKLLGDIAASSEQWGQAITCYETALEREPGFISVKNNLAWCLSKRTPPALDRALLLVDEAIADQERMTPNQRSPNIIETRGQILVKLGRYNEGVTHLEQALRYMPEASRRSVHVALAEAYSKMGHESMADIHKRLVEGEVDSNKVR